MTMTALARMSGCSHSLISRILSGERAPDLQMAERWADFLGVPAQERERWMDEAALAHVPDAGRRQRLERLLDLASDAERIQTDLLSLRRGLRDVLVEYQAGPDPDPDAFPDTST